MRCPFFFTITLWCAKLRYSSYAIPNNDVRGMTHNAHIVEDFFQDGKMIYTTTYATSPNISHECIPKKLWAMRWGMVWILQSGRLFVSLASIIMLDSSQRSIIAFPPTMAFPRSFPSQQHVLVCIYCWIWKIHT